MYKLTIPAIGEWLINCLQNERLKVQLFNDVYTKNNFYIIYVYTHARGCTNVFTLESALGGPHGWQSTTRTLYLNRGSH